MTDVTLEAMMRRVSRMAEKMFDEEGAIVQFWWLDTPRGQELIVSPVTWIEGMSRGESKDLQLSHLREKFAELGVTRYVHAVEAWSLQGDRSDPMPDSIRDHPLRKEIVMIDGDDGVRHLLGVRKIYRPANRAPYLGRLEIMGAHSGRYAGMLPVRNATKH